MNGADCSQSPRRPDLAPGGNDLPALLGMPKTALLTGERPRYPQVHAAERQPVERRLESFDMTTKDLPVVTFRTARIEDVDELARMRFTLQKHMHASNSRLLHMSPRAIDDLPQQYRLRVEDPERRIVVSEERSGGLVGMAMGTIANRNDLLPPRCGRIDDVWVDPQHRRRGVAKRLVSDLLAFFEENRVATLVLDYAVGNDEARRTWKALGFEPILTVASTTPDELQRTLGRTVA